MSSRTIEREIVAMDFDAKMFAAGIEQSLRDLDKFKGALKFDREAKNLSNLGSSASNLNFNGLGQSIGTVTAKISTLGVITAEVVRQITSSIISATKDLFSQNIIKPALAGLAEYELQMNSIQTILANTSMKGTVLSDVQKALDELNEYADRTIYNFSQMTDSIGKFTAAGVDLDVSVGAIKGIANVAAVSGSNAQQASTAMYQLSQAVASGTVKLQDWNSVVNAGMGGQVFQDALVETARVHGVAIDAILEKEGGFRGSLQTGWLSSQILLDTLNKFTGDLTASQLEQIGYTEEQIVKIIELGDMANDAATKIKTLTQLKDTMAEAAQSGWAQTWRTIIGDFNEAKELFGGLGDVFGSVIEQSAEARNTTLDWWKRFGGRDELMTALFTGLEAGINIMRLFKEAWSDVFPKGTAWNLYQNTVALKEFVEKFKMGAQQSLQFKSAVRGIASALDIVKMLLVAIAEPIVEYIKSLNKGGESILSIAGRAGLFVTKLRDTIIETDYFRVAVANLIAKVKLGIERLKEMKESFEKLGVIRTILGYLRSLEKPDFSKLSTFFIYLKDKIPFISDKIKIFGAYIKDVLEVLDAKIPKIIDGFRNFKSFIIGISTGAKSLKESFLGLESVEKFITLIKSFDGSRFKNFISDFKNQFSGIGTVIDKVRGLFGSLMSLVFGGGSEKGSSSSSDGTKNEMVTKAITMIDGAFSEIFDYLLNAAGNIDFVGLLGVINGAIVTAIGASLAGGIKSFFNGSWIDAFMSNLLGGKSSLRAASNAFVGAFKQIESTMVSFQTNLKADALLKIAGALAILVASIFLMTLLDSNKLLLATGAMAALLGQLIGASSLLGKLDTATLVKATTSIVALSVSLLILSLALHSFAAIDPDTLAKGLLATGASLTGLVLAVRGLGGGASASLIKQAATMTILSLSLLVLAKAVKTFGTLDAEVIEKGMIRIGIALAGFVGFSRIMNEKDMLLAAVDVGLIAQTLIFLADAILKFGSMSWEVLIRGLVGVGVAMGMMALAAKAMSGSIHGAIAMLIMSGAIFVMSKALEALSALSWEELLKSLVGLAGIFLVLGLAGLVLVPVIPALIGIGVALLLIGIGTAALGLGIMLVATGLILIAGSAAVMGTAIAIVGTAIMVLIPKIAEAIALGVVSFLTTLADAAPQLLEAGKTLLLTLVQSVTETLPEILIAIVDMLNAILDTLVENVPGFVEKGFELLLGFLKGIEDNIQEVVITAVNIVTNLIKGLSDSIPDLIAAAFELVIALINGMADAIETYTPQLLVAITNLGNAIIDALTMAIKDGIAPVVDSLISMAKQGMAAFADALGIHSPSRVFTGFAANIIDSFVNRVNEGKALVKSTFSSLSQITQNGMSSVIQDLNSIVSSDMNLVPVIRPVMDLSDFRSGISNMNKSIRNTGPLSFATEGSINGNGVSNASGTTYIQNNYSPKSLSSAEVYRMTKMQLGKLKEGTV